MPTPKSNSWPVIIYPEGLHIGRVRSGKDPRSSKVRHIAFLGSERIGTFDTYTSAEGAVKAEWRLRKNT